MWGRAQQFMTIFAREGNLVIYVDPPVTYLSALKNPALKHRPAGKVRAVSGNIHVYVPPVFLPFGNMYRWINRVNQRRLAAGLRGVLRGLGLTPTICWTYLPNTVDLLPFMPLPPGGVVVYDCADDHAAFPGLIDREVVNRMEAELFRRAQVSLASAAELQRRKKSLAPNLLLVPNGADVGHFARALDPDLPLPPDLAALPRPVIGYAGAVSEWLDQELVAAAARACSEGSVVLIGAIDTDVSYLRSLPNVHLLGWRDYRDLPAYFKGFDVALIPFKVNELTRAVNPVKLYEYLAAGLPVVSADLPEVRPFASLVEVARSPEEFAAAVKSALAGNSPGKTAARLAEAARHSWLQRARLAAAAVAQSRK
jgi:glycosyltransferase involved in cell wall biosynthesis